MVEAPVILDFDGELAELAAIEAESIGWLPLAEGAYLHVGNADPLVRREVRELTLTIRNYAKDLLFVRACI